MHCMTFLVNSLFGQKHFASLLELHFGVRVSHVLMHCGTVLGQGADGTGEVPVAPGAEGTVVAVSIVDVEVRVIVDTVLEVVVIVLEPEVVVPVTGQVVVVSYVTTVVVDSPGGVKVAAAPDETGVVPAPVGLVLDPQAVQIVDVEVKVIVDTVLEVVVIVLVPEVVVPVTGQVVVVS